MADLSEERLPVEEKAAEAPAPWYSLNPKHLRFSKFTWMLLLGAGIIMLLANVSTKAIWQYTWRTHLQTPWAFSALKTASGGKIPGGAWCKSKRIVVYGMPGVREKAIAEAAVGMRILVNELGLDFVVEQIPVPPDAVKRYREACRAATNGRVSFDLDRFEKGRLDDRGDDYAEMVVVNAQFRDPSWAFGLSDFSSGLAALQQDQTSAELGRHEGAHLLGYMRHDSDAPAMIFGYRESWPPGGRDTLMMLLSQGTDTLSERAHDALINFWRGMETRDHQRYFRAGATR